MLRCSISQVLPDSSALLLSAAGCEAHLRTLVFRYVLQSMSPHVCFQERRYLCPVPHALSLSRETPLKTICKRGSYPSVVLQDGLACQAVFSSRYYNPGNGSDLRLEQLHSVAFGFPFRRVCPGHFLALVRGVCWQSIFWFFLRPLCTLNMVRVPFNSIHRALYHVLSAWRWPCKYRLATCYWLAQRLRYIYHEFDESGSLAV